MSGSLFLADGGIETTLIFHDGLTLRDFAAFELLNTAEGEAALRRYFRSYAEIARRNGTGVILETATWRASPDWAKRLGHTPEALADFNRKAVALLESIRREYGGERTPVVISGCVGPRGDGYVPGKEMTEDEAERYHLEQIATFANTAADMVCAITMNYAQEAAGVALAARRAGMPVALSFTVETDGKLPTGQTLEEAIEQVERSTSRYPVYYMINCAHPTHFDGVLKRGARWVDRVHGLRANASRMSHAQLNESTTLDAGNPKELGEEYAALKRRLPQLNVMGGCCGTDHRHIERIAEACVPLFR
jgi:S-methylmethionine-dependent homocysteine/selenocysteine methylase